MFEISKGAKFKIEYYSNIVRTQKPKVTIIHKKTMEPLRR